MKILGIIPARFASTRFPGKPLVDIAGVSMIERVYRQALKANSLSGLVVATDDHRIFAHVEAFGGNVVMTSPEHPTGTDRCREVISQKPWQNFEVVLNIQGDEPLIDPAQINLLASLFNDPSVKIGTLIRQMANPDHLKNPNVVKVTVGTQYQAIAFSRSPIPFLRNFPEEVWLKHHTYFEHIGMYGFVKTTLEQVAALNPTPNEIAESLEQLRWLDHGIPILTAISNHLSCSVDTPEDLEAVVSLLKNKQS